MEKAEIAWLISTFNSVSASVFAVLAVLGAAALLCRRFRKQKRGKKGQTQNRLTAFLSRHGFFTAFCAAALAAFLPELTYFNAQHYMKYFADEEIYTTGASSADNPNAYLLSNGSLMMSEDVASDEQTAILRFRFNDLDKRVTSIYADLDYDHRTRVVMSAKWTDEEGTPVTIAKQIHRGFPHDRHTPITPRGKISELELTFAIQFLPDDNESMFKFNQIALNRQIPLYVSGLRLLAVTLLFFAVFVLLNKELRNKARMFLFEYKFDPTNKKQNIIYALIIALLVLFTWLSVYTSLVISEWERPQHQMYNVYLVDALIAGRTWLDYGNPEQMLEWGHNPYDHHWRIANKRTNVDWMWEWTWYKGKYYSHYGVVPAIILYVPYKLLTGNYLSNHGGIFIFSAIAVVMLALLWRHCVRRWMPDAAFAFYLLGYLTLFFASGVHTLTVFTRYYTIGQAAAVMFAVSGVYLLLKSVKKNNLAKDGGGNICRVKLFFACLCLALIAGCRPNMLFVSLLVPVVLWKYRSWKLLAFIAIPYIIVALPLGWYNYIRFESFYDFGHNYVLTSNDHSATALFDPVARLIRSFTIFAYYLFAPNKYSLVFPYVEIFPPSASGMMMGSSHSPGAGTGIINFPIVFCLFYMFKNMFSKEKLQTLPLLFGFLLVAAVTMIPIAWAFHFSPRYLADFAIFIILPSLFCAYYWYSDNKSGLQPETARMKCVYVLLGICILVGVFLYVTGGMEQYAEFRETTMLRYLEYSLSIFRGN